MRGKCSKGHELRLSTLPVVYVRQCQCCKADLPRQVQRYLCRRCSYDVCFDCGMQFTKRYLTTATTADLSDAEDFPSEVNGGGCAGLEESQRSNRSIKRTLRSKFRMRIDQKQTERERFVMISKQYDIVNPGSGDKRVHAHSRKGMSMTDCHFVCFSDAMLDLRGVHGALNVRPFAQITDCNTAGRALAEAVVQRAMILIDVVGSEIEMSKDCTDCRWQPALPDAAMYANKLKWLFQDGDSQLAKVHLLCNTAQELFSVQPVVSEVHDPAMVFGDTHGQLRDILLFFHLYGRPGQTLVQGGAPLSFVFNGDFVDRGAHQVEVITLLLALKIKYPNLVWLNRGNHEDAKQNKATSNKGKLGFDQACNDQFGDIDGEEAFAAFQRTFAWLPLAARVGERALVIHGGLGKGDWTLDMLRAVQRPLTSDALLGALDGAVYNILWSDPLAPDRIKPQQAFGVHDSPRAKHSTVMKGFGRDVTEKFCAREGLSLIIRSHQFKQNGKGYEILHDGWLMRVFSARNYCGRAANDGAVLMIGRAAHDLGTLLVQPLVVERMARWQNQLASTDTNLETIEQSEPYCPKGHLMDIVVPRQHPGCLSLSRYLKPDAVNVECNMCGSEDLQRDFYFRCRGCGTKPFDLCLDCAQQATTAQSGNSFRRDTEEEIAPSDSDSSDGESVCAFPVRNGFEEHFQRAHPVLLGKHQACNNGKDTKSGLTEQS